LDNLTKTVTQRLPLFVRLPGHALAQLVAAKKFPRKIGSLCRFLTVLVARRLAAHCLLRAGVTIALERGLKPETKAGGARILTI
jgi:hypothetical protein